MIVVREGFGNLMERVFGFSINLVFTVSHPNFRTVFYVASAENMCSLHTSYRIFSFRLYRDKNVRPKLNVPRRFVTTSKEDEWP